MPHRGLISARKKRQENYAILRELRDIFKVGTFREIVPVIKTIIKEREMFKQKFEAILSEFNKKKIDGLMIIKKRPKYVHTTKKGVLYFHKQHIGKKVIVWEKP